MWLTAGAATAGAAGVPERVRRVTGGDSAPATVADLHDAVSLADALPEVAVLAGPPLRAAGLSVTPRSRAASPARASTSWPACSSPRRRRRDRVALAAALAGSAAEARRRPPLSLCGGADAVDAALVFARAGLPVGTGAGAGRCRRRCCRPAARRRRRRPKPPAPHEADLGLTLVRHHAGVLAGCAAVQAAAPGAPFLYVADPAAAGLPPAGPQASLFQLAAAQLAARVGLPFVAGGLRTTSHEPDWQAGLQDAFVSMTTTASGADVTGGAGLLGAAAAFSPQQLVMDTEIFSWNAFIASGIAVDEETIALEAIKQVGIGGNYLGQRHTGGT